MPPRSRLVLLDLDVDEGRAKDAEAPARDALAVLQRLKVSDGEASARGLLARILFSLGRGAEAKAEAGRSVALAVKSENRALRFSLEIAAARIAGFLGDADRKSSADSLRRLQTEAARAGILPLVFEARLALGEIEVRSSRTAGQDHLRLLQKDAALKGFTRIASRAAAAAR